jgi:NADP-dependent 3-hydroxy acid dehydrogenase YdfG
VGITSRPKACAKRRGVKAGSWKVDVTNEKETKRVFEEIVREMGEVDVLVNNAATQRRRPYAMDNVVDWWRVVEINLKGV